jgi:hypothetical protein
VGEEEGGDDASDVSDVSDGGARFDARAERAALERERQRRMPLRYVHTNTYIHTYIHTYTHTYIHTLTLTLPLTLTCRYFVYEGCSEAVLRKRGLTLADVAPAHLAG